MDFRSNALNRWRATWTLSSMAVIGFGFNNQSWIVYIYIFDLFATRFT